VEAYKKDIDRTLIRENLKLTVEERFRKSMALARFAEEMRRAGREARSRKAAHHLIDRLPETQLSALVGLLETIVDPVAAALRNAPLDDEPETEDEKQAVNRLTDAGAFTAILLNSLNALRLPAPHPAIH